MKKVVLLSLMFAASLLGAKELRVLTIGNSFSASVSRNLPWLVASVPDCRIILTGAQIGGCSLERHWKEWQTAEKNPEHKPYSVVEIDSANLPPRVKGERGNVNSLVKNNRYDIITIQQSSANGWKYETYQPYADNLIAELRRYQPQAEIVIQQTWSYRADSARLKAWKMTNEEMYRKLEAAYRQLADAYGFRMIPCGCAVQIFRAKTPVKFQVPDTKLLEARKNESPHGFDGEVVGFHRWRLDRKTSKYRLFCDAHHLNPHGEYLQSAVWFSFLFDRPATDIRYIPVGMTQEQAKFLLECAQEAVTTFRQVPMHRRVDTTQAKCASHAFIRAAGKVTADHGPEH